MVMDVTKNNQRVLGDNIFCRFSVNYYPQPEASTSAELEKGSAIYKALNINLKNVRFCVQRKKSIVYFNKHEVTDLSPYGHDRLKAELMIEL